MAGNFMLRRLFRSRRAAEEGVNVVRILVLGLIIAIPLIIFAVKFVAVGKSSGSNEACRLSIISAGMTKKGVQLVTGDVLHINCPSEEVLIKKRDVSKGGEISWDLINGVLARELYNCYVKTAGGKYNPYRKDMQGKTYCLICSRINFDKALNGTMLTGSQLYLAVKRVPGQKKSFYELVYGDPVDSESMELYRDVAAYGGDTIPLDRPYVIVWRLGTFDIEGSRNDLMGKMVLYGAGIGAAGGGIPGALVGAGVGAVMAAGAYIGSYIFFWTDDDKPILSSYEFMPEEALSMRAEEVFGNETPWRWKDGQDMCTQVFDMS